MTNRQISKNKYGKNLTAWCLLVLSGLLLPNNAFAQTPVSKPLAKIDSNYNHAHYQQRTEFFRKSHHFKHPIVFLGNSITEHGEWQEVFDNHNIINRGIGGDNTFGVLARLDEVLATKPRKIFLLIGINDLSRRLPIDVIVNNYKRIITRVKRESPKTTLYIQSVLPVRESMTTASYLKNISPLVTELNKRTKELAAAEHLIWINLHPLVAAPDGQLREELSRDGIHLKPEAYITWANYLKSQKYL
ncbi:GDSL-type esterase/lipase family protein [Desertivirga brevis]|uniref:GDSL-type esterase/lipase family protein n=1 Tax=Desertivirga brevis TaxID=2810310 RepID=UPI001A96892D|nr:GDSL-type esterase/lipase family protein [Pedobacter sp. SYSU D00873]